MKDTLHYLLMANHLTFQNFLLTGIKDTELTPGQPKVLDFLRNHNGAVQKEIQKPAILPLLLSRLFFQEWKKIT